MALELKFIQKTKLHWVFSDKDVMYLLKFLVVILFKCEVITLIIWVSMGSGVKVRFQCQCIFDVRYVGYFTCQGT